MRTAESPFPIETTYASSDAEAGRDPDDASPPRQAVGFKRIAAPLIARLRAAPTGRTCAG